MAMDASCAPSMRWNATRLAPESTTATLSFQSCFFASATAAASALAARSREIGAPYGTSNGMLSGTVSSGLAVGGVCASPDRLGHNPVAARARVSLWKCIGILLGMGRGKTYGRAPAAGILV